MSAQALGAGLLAQVREEGLDELLSDLRHLVPNPKPQLGVPSLDRLLEIFCAPAQAQATAANIWSSSEENEETDRYGDDDYDDPARRHLGVPQDGRSRWKPVVVELTSARPASGKTNFLYYITALAVLPGSHGGQGTAVVWLDTDGRFSAMRLREVMTGVLSTSAKEESDKESLVQEALSHVHVFRPQSSLQLIETLESLPSYLLDATAHSSIRRQLGLVILDSATAFYWQDRLHAETVRFEHPNEPQDRPSRTVEVITRLKRLQEEFDCAILFSTSRTSPFGGRHALAEAEENAAPREPRSISPWTAFAVLTLILARVKVPQFAEHMSLKECLRDRSTRQEAVAKGMFMAEVDCSGVETWTSEMKDRLRRMEADEKFAFSIGSGVSV